MQKKMDVRSTKSDVRSELKSIKQDLLQLASFVDRVVERITNLETSVEASSRKRHAPRETDSDTFSEDDQSMHPKLLKMEQDFKTNLNSSDNNNVSSNRGSSIKAKPEASSRAFLANATKPVAVPRPSTSASSSSVSISSSSKATPPASSSNQFDASIGPVNREENRIVIYTDGSCTNNGKPNAKGGIGVYFHDNSPLNISAPLPGKQSNNRAELQAAVKALMVVREKNFGPVQIRTDSGYVKQGITSWIKTWKKNGWRTASGNEVKNVDDWKELDAIQATVDVEWKWVEAHKGIHGNEMADRLANEGAGNKR